MTDYLIFGGFRSPANYRERRANVLAGMHVELRGSQIFIALNG
ncbi:hypothetical protein [Paraburkholderia fynbosensis]|nr:hypothetical protein [Paraburkholderia fynbosensis]